VWSPTHNFTVASYQCALRRVRLPIASEPSVGAGLKPAPTSQRAHLYHLSLRARKPEAISHTPPSRPIAKLPGMGDRCIQHGATQGAGLFVSVYRDRTVTASFLSSRTTTAVHHGRDRWGPRHH
jgi:hypothetical protein